MISLMRNVKLEVREILEVKKLEVFEIIISIDD